ncbi:MAG: hypothetical protein WCI75_10385, partial [candidate division NC10 bacterium]
MARRKTASAAAPASEPFFLTTVLLSLFYGPFLARKISLVTADLGRHLKNGEIFLRTFSPIATNYYSYTQPDFPVVNHHWGSGIVFYLVWKLGGFPGLHVFFIGLSLLAFLIVFNIARKEAGPGIAALTAIAMVPLLAERTEVRPEAFSYLFAALFLHLLIGIRKNSIRPRWALALPIIEAIWVNSHIYFFLGPVILCAFLLEYHLDDPPRTADIRTHWKALGLTLAATCLSPFGLKSALAPLSIFENYGYRLVENQPVWFIQRILHNPNCAIFEGVFALFAASFVIAWFRGRRREGAAGILLGALVSGMAWLAIRNFAIFGLIALPLAARNIAWSFPGFIDARRKGLRRLSLAALAALCLLAWYGKLQAIVPYSRELGIGLEAGNGAAADFIRRVGIRGPIFNNYDIGGYLIYHLFPGERVFVDNRPEAYSKAFFEDTYIPMQQDGKVWSEVD